MDYTVKNLLSPYIYNDITDIYKTDKFACFKNKTVLITGAGQLIGYYLTCVFLAGNDG
jgi:FlaA1/EpsC-like NDP-sugar epimerase